MEAMREVLYDDWDIKYQGNRFAWLGNGYSQTELDQTADWPYYISNEDHSPYLSTRKQREVFDEERDCATRGGGAGWGAKIVECNLLRADLLIFPSVLDGCHYVSLFTLVETLIAEARLAAVFTAPAVRCNHRWNGRRV